MLIARAHQRRENANVQVQEMTWLFDRLISNDARNVALPLPHLRGRAGVGAPHVTSALAEAPPP